MKSKTIDSFLKKKSTETTQSPLEASQIEVPPSSFVPLNSDARPSKILRVEDEALDLSNLERELGLRCAFRGHDESSGSKNCGNFLELLSLLALYDEKVEDILKSAPKNASYTSSTIQKEILQIYANRVRNVIREEIGDRKFSIIMDEARDESKKEQMTIILKFADKQRQLALVATAREVVEGHQLFKDLSDIVNIASTSSKRHDELQKAQAAEITRLVSINELATGTKMNQIGTLQRPGETRWSSHLNLVTSLLKIYIKKEDVTVEHHYQVDIFFATIDTQLQELKSRFNENVVELLTFTTALDHNELFKLFDINKICILVNKFYPEDFSQQEKECLPYELKHYELDFQQQPQDGK
ncbi:uncharacterized protein [Gossypium hirsutum]|uniref:DUF4371 domain-containing protein n=1 Tax=Gossypium hirsutum TaxID=3635 RepID=A0A1U8JWA2_GOSHI|nr:uncharacterized protein LOC107911188 [Gossypium hirsutum]